MIRTGVALLLGCTVIACRTGVPPGVALAPEDPRPAALLGRLHAQAASRPALRASAKLELDAPDFSWNRPQRIAIARPAKLRVEILGLFNQIAAVLVTDGEIYQLWNADEIGLEEGLVGPGLLWRVARVDLAPEQVVDLLLGAPAAVEERAAGRAWISPDGAILVEEHDTWGAARQRFAFDREGRLESLLSLDARGEVVYEARYGDYRELAAPGGGEALFPHSVALRFPRVDAEARLTFKQVRLVADLPESLFVLELPERASRQRL